MQKLLEGDKDYNIGKLQEILERAEKKHTLEDLGIYSFIYIYICTITIYPILSPCLVVQTQLWCLNPQPRSAPAALHQAACIAQAAL
jgi:hypothetical protein